MQFSDIIKVPFGYVLEWLYQLTNSYGMALILFAVAIKLILMPLTMKSKKSMMKMSRMAPRVKALEIKYGSDQAKYQQEVMKLYKKENISPTGGCLWSFIPLLILIPLYQVIREPLVYMMHLSRENATEIVEFIKASHDLGKNVYYEQMAAASYLGTPGMIESLKAAIPALANVNIAPMNFSFLGADLGAIPTWHFWALSGWAEISLFLIPVVSGLSNWLSMWVSQKLNNSVTTNNKGEVDKEAAKANNSMKAMNIMMPLMSLFIGFQMPAAISIYWIAQAVVGVVQEFFMTKHYRKIYDAEDEVRRQEALVEEMQELEKERIRAERRAKLGDVVDPNTSKKKLAAKEKAEHANEFEGKLTPEEREARRQAQEEARIAAALSGIPDRPNCRGRAYEPNRYKKGAAEEPAQSADESKE